ncbi:hypothetical protein [Carboxylicivirga marina]|uniref:hypothetical protein n=1 Tax=Carboxylicivirga marina TaxID=2800988 RepID=UPI002592F668|nr:hypothetical protein [uncultured Carboxylicivirga sp.]
MKNKGLLFDTKTSCLLVLLLFIFTNTISSQTLSTLTPKTNNTFIGLGLGINEYGVGIDVEKKGEYFWYFCGAGISTWGYRLTAGLSYYLNNSGYKSSFKLGYSYASGITNFTPTLEVYVGGYGGGYGGYGGSKYVEKEVLMDLFPTHTINLIYSYNLKVGKKSKFVFSGGYSVKLSDELYENKSDYWLTDKSKDFIELMAPGGIIIGVKFMIGI